MSGPGIYQFVGHDGFMAWMGATGAQSHWIAAPFRTPMRPVAPGDCGPLPSKRREFLLMEHPLHRGRGIYTEDGHTSSPDSGAEAFDRLIAASIMAATALTLPFELTLQSRTSVGNELLEALKGMGCDPTKWEPR